MSIFELEKNQIIYKQSPEILNQYQDLFKSIFPDINLDASTPQGQIISFLTEIDNQTIAFLNDLINYSFNGGNAEMLDIWAFNNYGIKRKDSIDSYVFLTITTKSPNTLIPKGAEFSNGKITFKTYQDYLTDGNNQVIVTAYAKTTETAEAKSVNQNLNKDLDVVLVENQTASVAGENTESDSSFYARCINYGSIIVNGTLQSIKANVANVEGVVSVTAIENISSKKETILGVSMRSHSIALVVLGGEDAKIAEAIKSSKPVGCGLNGNVAVSLKNEDFVTTYNFFRPQQISIFVKISLLKTEFLNENYQDLILKSINRYFQNLEIGVNAYLPNLTNAILIDNPNFKILELQATTTADDSTFSNSPLFAKFDTIWNLQSENLQINLAEPFKNEK